MNNPRGTATAHSAGQAGRADPPPLSVQPLDPGAAGNPRSSLLDYPGASASGAFPDTGHGHPLMQWWIEDEILKASRGAKNAGGHNTMPGGPSAQQEIDG